jgi:hypothetical protein
MYTLPEFLCLFGIAEQPLDEPVGEVGAVGLAGMYSSGDYDIFFIWVVVGLCDMQQGYLQPCE